MFLLLETIGDDSTGQHLPKSPKHYGSTLCKVGNQWTVFPIVQRLNVMLLVWQPWGRGKVSHTLKHLQKAALAYG